MVFAKQYSRKARAGTGGVVGPLSIAPAAHKFEVSTKTSTRIWARLLGIQELFTHHLAPTLSTRDLLRLSATCHELAAARAFVTELVVRRDVRRSGVPRAIRLGLPQLPGLRVLDLSFVDLQPRDITGLAHALLKTLPPPPAASTSTSTTTSSSSEHGAITVAVKGGPKENLRAFRVRQRGTYPPSPMPLERDLCLLRLLAALVSTKAWPLLEELDLSGNGIGDAGVELVAAWLEVGGGSSPPRRLKKLGLSGVNLGHRGLLRLLRPLAKGRTPLMLRLDLSANSAEAVDGVAAELEEGLALGGGVAAGAAAGAAGAAAAGGERAGASTATAASRVVDALWAAALCGMPHLLELELRESGVEGEVTRALARALGRGAGRRLKRISLGGCSITDQDAEAFFGCLADGCCPYLQDLNLRQACLEPPSFARAAAALAARALPFLRRLDLSDNLISYEGMQEVVTALQAGGGPQLRSLRLASTGPEFVEVNEMARLWMAKLRADGHCPHLALEGEDGGGGGAAPGSQQQPMLVAALAPAAAAGAV